MDEPKPTPPPSDPQLLERARRLIHAFDHPIRAERHEALAQVVALGPGAVPMLVRALRAESPKIRAGTLRALTQLGAPEALPALATYLEEHRTELGDNRAFAMQAIAASVRPDLSDRARWVKALRGHLSDPDGFVQGWALDALGRLQARELRAEIERRAASRDPFVAQKAAEALGRLASAPARSGGAGFARDAAKTRAPEHAHDADDALALALTSPSASQRDAAMRALLERAAHGEHDPMPLLTRLVHGPSKVGRRVALEALGRVDDPRAGALVVELLGQGAVDDERKALALRALASAHTLGTVSSEGVLGLAERFMRHRDVFVRAGALHALAGVDPRRARGLRVVALSDPEAWVRDDALNALEAEEGVALEPYLQGLAEALVRAVGRLGQVAAAQASSPRAGAAEAALEAEARGAERVLGLIESALPAAPGSGGDEAVAAAALQLMGAPRAGLRVAGLRLLDATTRRGARVPLSGDDIARLGSALSSTRRPVIDRALGLLERLLPEGSAAATPWLIEALYRGDRDTALRIVELLGRAGDMEAIHALEALTRNEDVEVASSAMAVLSLREGTP